MANINIHLDPDEFHITFYSALDTLLLERQLFKGIPPISPEDQYLLDLHLHNMAFETVEECLGYFASVESKFLGFPDEENFPSTKPGAAKHAMRRKRSFHHADHSERLRKNLKKSLLKKYSEADQLCIRHTRGHKLAHYQLIRTTHFIASKN